MGQSSGVGSPYSSATEGKAKSTLPGLLMLTHFVTQRRMKIVLRTQPGSSLLGCALILAVCLLRVLATSEDTSAHATGLTTTHRVGSARGQPLRICRSQTMNSTSTRTIY